VLSGFQHFTPFAGNKEEMGVKKDFQKSPAKKQNVDNYHADQLENHTGNTQ
jgi:hypothetical protein